MRNVGSSLRIIWKLSGSYCSEEVLEEVRCVIMKSHNDSIWTLVVLRKQLCHEVETREKNAHVHFN